MQQINLTLDLATLEPHQHQALLDLIESLKKPYVIPTHDESAERDEEARGR